MRMHAAPGGVQMPQLALQQTCPGGQTVGPHDSPGHNVSEHAVVPGKGMSNC
jgi:hypothetical protein